MGEAVFEVRDAGRLVCDHPDCDRLQRYDIRLIGSGAFPRMVCRFHKHWAKSRLVDCERRRQRGDGEETDG
jgi:hypothetical protein